MTLAPPQVPIWPPPIFETFQVIFSPDLDKWIAMYSATEGVMFDTEQEAVTFHGAYKVVDPSFASEMLKIFIANDRIAHK